MAELKVTMVIEGVELADWAADYGIPISEVKGDIKNAAALAVEDYLKRVGYNAANVRVAAR